MKISLSWLQDFVDISISANELADVLTSLGLEVASVDKRHVPTGIKVARILDVAQHPNADKLHICKVDAGLPDPLTIVCGAPNVVSGMLAPLATIGTKFSDDFTISRAKLRGVESFGMLCSQKELGLSDDNSGLFSLPHSMNVGDELAVYFPDDFLLEVELTPNRGDCLSVLGIARDVAAKLKVPLKNTALVPQESKNDAIHEHITVCIDAPKECPRYCARLVRNIQIRPSPQWMAKRLADAGVRPINNVVDITNYIMLHFGQPMHAFDYSLINDKKIIVRKAGETTSFVTLDKIQRTLKPDDLLICDAVRPVALAGVMGGAGSEISATTTEVLLECAYFNPVQVRKTSKRLGLSTESSYRFERGVDPEGALLDALDTAAEMLRLYADGTVASGTIDVYPEPVSHTVITLRMSRIKRLLGITLSKLEVVPMLSSLTIAVLDKSEDILECTVPPYRHDITCEADLVEEVGRMYGYDTIPSAAYASVGLDTVLSSTESRIDTIRMFLAYSGFNEIMVNSLTSAKKNNMVRPDAKPVTLLNPQSPDMAELRTSMIPGNLEVLAYNINRKNSDNRYFEIGKTYEALEGSLLPRERTMLSLVVAGNYFAKAWNNANEALSDDTAKVYVLKGILEKLCETMGHTSFTYTAISDDANCFEPGCGIMLHGDIVQGFLGILQKKLCNAFDIKESVLFAQLDITEYCEKPVPRTTYKSLPKYPALERDFCFVIADDVQALTISNEIYAQSPLIENVVPFDVYRGEKLGAGIKSIAFNVLLRSPDRTLTDKEAEDICAKIIASMAQKFSATLRT